METGLFHVESTDGRSLARTLSPWEQDRCLQVLGRVTMPNLRKWLAKQGGSEVTEARRLCVLRILGAHGQRADLSSLLHWTVDVQSRERVPRSLRTAFLDALIQVLGRDPQALQSVPEIYRAAHPSLLPAIAHAVGASQQPGCVDTLTSLLDVVPKANSLLLTEVAQAVQTQRGPTKEPTLQRLQSALQVSEGETLTAAIHAAGETGLRTAVPHLIDWLKSEDPNLRNTAHVALQQITKQQFRVEPDRWQSWYQREMTWWQQEYTKLKSTAIHGLGGHASNALKEISKRRFFREATAPDLAACLDRPEQELVVLTCAVLGHLGSKSSVPPLLGKLASDQPLAVRKAAYDALRRITEENHGEQPDAWRAAGW